MKTHKITVKKEDWNESKYRARKWEERVDVSRWEHDYVTGEHHIEINIK
jgi:hypothetical protein